MFSTITLAQEPCINVALKTRIQELTLSAIDDAYRRQIVNLFEIWLVDLESTRWTLGMAKNTKAYLQARSNALSWNPKVCEKE